jgi:hypothetical protein
LTLKSGFLYFMLVFTGVGGAKMTLTGARFGIIHSPPDSADD